MDPHCFDADPEPDPDPAQNLDADPDPDPGGGGRSAKNLHPPRQNPRYAPASVYIMRNNKIHVFCQHTIFFEHFFNVKDFQIIHFVTVPLSAI